MMKKQIIVITGPTASGKTALSIKLAKALQTEIISADSRQFYKEMSIGTAVPEPEELAAVKHHFIQHKSIFDSYNVGDYEQDFIRLTKQLFQKYNQLILVGGSGLYIDAACKGLDDLPGYDKLIRKKLEDEFKKNGIEKLQEILQKLDIEHYHKIDIHNPHRLIRAIEILEQSKGKKMSELLQKKQPRDFDSLYIGLNTDRKILYERINKRVDIMIQKGLTDEARKLYPYKDLNALQTVGYREMFQYFEGKIDLEFAVSEIKKNTRRYAKRQLTWFRKNKNIHWFDLSYNLQDILQIINNQSV
jgi:tRNA dimethylallyltransferase